MDFGKLKQLARKIGGIVVMDGDTPELVILPYAAYQNLAERHPTSYEDEPVPEDGIIERLNQEILVLKEEIRQKEAAELLESEVPESTELSS